MPTFGQRFTNEVASDDNPTKHGMFVETITRAHGQMNPGTWWRLTDGRGRFWESRPENLAPCHLDEPTPEPDTPDFVGDPLGTHPPDEPWCACGFGPNEHRALDGNCPVPPAKGQDDGSCVCGDRGPITACPVHARLALDLAMEMAGQQQDGRTRTPPNTPPPGYESLPPAWRPDRTRHA